MAYLLQFIGTPSAAVTAVAGMQAQPGNAPEAAFVARFITFLQTEITQLGAANSVQIFCQGSRTEKTLQLEFNMDKATPVLNQQIVSLSNQSPAN